jgi:cytidylate kinase
LLADLDQIKIQFRYTLKGQQTFLNGKEISKAIREADVTAQVSQVAKLPEVRSFLVIQQQAMGVNKGIVMDGRDIGTVVFPEAECKFFLTARPEIRAKRRHLEQLEQGNKQAFESVLANLKERDYLDSNRTTSPMVRAEDAIEIDVSDASIDEVYEVLWSHISEKIAL